MQTFPLFWIPLLPLLGAAVNLIIGRKLPRWLVSTIACASVGAACAIAVYAVAGPLYDGWKAARLAGADVAPIVNDVYTWIRSGALTVEVSFLLDPLSAVMVLVITFVGFLIHVYSIGYMAEEPRLAAYFGYLNLFSWRSACTGSTRVARRAGM
jgi:NADH-quinone oxidoreductase subunit L